MNTAASWTHFSLPASQSHDGEANLPVTETQRERCFKYLQQVYAQGRIGRADFENRLSQALVARNRGELNQSFAGLSFPSAPTQTGVSRSPLYDLLIARPVDSAPLLGRMVHWSGLLTLFIGPAFVYALSSRGSANSREAARAFNFQLSIFFGWIISGIIESAFDFWFPALVLTIIWLIGSLVGGVWAARGNDSRKLKLVTPLRLLDDGSRKKSSRELRRG